MLETKQYVVRVFGKADSYGLGEIVSPGVALFKAGMYDLTRDQLEQKLKQSPKGQTKSA